MTLKSYVDDLADMDEILTTQTRCSIGRIWEDIRPSRSGFRRGHWCCTVLVLRRTTIQ